jgi:hypothetical protein
MIVECTKIMGKNYNPNLGTKYQLFFKNMISNGQFSIQQKPMNKFKHDMTLGNTYKY